MQGGNSTPQTKPQSPRLPSHADDTPLAVLPLGVCRLEDNSPPQQLRSDDTSSPHAHSPKPSASFLSPLSKPPPTISAFIFAHDAFQTTSVDVKRFLLGHGLLNEEIKSILSAGQGAFRVGFQRPVSVAVVQAMHGTKWEGASIRVEIDNEEIGRAPRFTSLRAGSAPRSRSLHRRRSLCPRRPYVSTATSRSEGRHQRPPSPPFSLPWWERERQAQIWAPHSGCYYTLDASHPRGPSPPEPPPRASQEELDHWAEESFVGRWAATFRGTRPGWVGKGRTWRG